MLKGRCAAGEGLTVNIQAKLYVFCERRLILSGVDENQTDRLFV